MSNEKLTGAPEIAYGSFIGYDNDSQFLHLFLNYEAARAAMREAAENDKNPPRDPLEWIRLHSRVVNAARAGQQQCPESVFFKSVFPDEVIQKCQNILLYIENKTWPETGEAKNFLARMEEELEEVVQYLRGIDRTTNYGMQNVLDQAVRFGHSLRGVSS